MAGLKFRRFRPSRKFVIERENYRVTTSVGGPISIEMLLPESGEVIEATLDPESAYEHAQAILRGYDVAVGIAPPR